MMADPESLGEAGVDLVEQQARTGAKVSVPTLTDPRGVDLSYYDPLGQTEQMANLERRFIAACQSMGIMMTNSALRFAPRQTPYGDAKICCRETTKKPDGVGCAGCDYRTQGGQLLGSASHRRY